MALKDHTNKEISDVLSAMSQDVDHCITTTFGQGVGFVVVMFDKDGSSIENGECKVGMAIARGEDLTLAHHALDHMSAKLKKELEDG